MEERPQIIVVGGPNGAGKTTFVKRLIDEFKFPYLGADQIAAEMRPESPESVAFEAGREFVRIINETIDSKTSFIVESTLSGRSLAKTIERAKAVDYEVDVNCVFVADPESSVDRVAHRVRLGGHHVPTNDVIRRFSRSLSNFWRLYRPLADTWSLRYNGSDGYLTVARSWEQENEDCVVVDTELFRLFHQLAGLPES